MLYSTCCRSRCLSRMGRTIWRLWRSHGLSRARSIELRSRPARTCSASCASPSSSVSSSRASRTCPKRSKRHEYGILCVSDFNFNSTSFTFNTVTSKICAYRDSNSDLSLSSQALCRLVHFRPGHCLYNVCRALYLFVHCAHFIALSNPFHYNTNERRLNNWSVAQGQVYATLIGWNRRGGRTWAIRNYNEELVRGSERDGDGDGAPNNVALPSWHLLPRPRQDARNRYIEFGVIGLLFKVILYFYLKYGTFQC